MNVIHIRWAGIARFTIPRRPESEDGRAKIGATTRVEIVRRMFKYMSTCEVKVKVRPALKGRILILSPLIVLVIMMGHMWSPFSKFLPAFQLRFRGRAQQAVTIPANRLSLAGDGIDPQVPVQAFIALGSFRWVSLPAPIQLTPLDWRIGMYIIAGLEPCHRRSRPHLISSRSRTYCNLFILHNYFT